MDGSLNGNLYAIEVVPCYLFLATADAHYMTGQFLHPNGGEIVNG